MHQLGLYEKDKYLIYGNNKRHNKIILSVQPNKTGADVYKLSRHQTWG